MWKSGSAVHAEDRQEDLASQPLTDSQKLTRWQKIQAWVRQRPRLTAVLALLAVGIIIAVIVGPVVGTQNKDKDDKKVTQAADATSTEYTLKFEAKDAPNVCSNFTDAAFLSSYGASLRSSIATVIGVDSSLVNVRTVQCGSETYQLPSASGAGRRLLAASGLSLAVVFRLTAPASGSQSLPPVSAITAALQSDKGRQTLVLAVSQALALPASSISFVGVTTTVITNAKVPSPPPSSPSPPLLMPVASIPVSAAPPPAPSYSGNDLSGVYGPTSYLTMAYPPRALLNDAPPVYGSPPPREQ